MKTDTQLQRDVIAELEWDPSINVTKIGLEVQEKSYQMRYHYGKNTHSVR